MKKRLVLMCGGVGQFGTEVEELSIDKAVKEINNIINNKTKEMIPLSTYNAEDNHSMSVRASDVTAVVVQDISNITVPNSKKIIGAGGMTN